MRTIFSIVLSLFTLIFGIYYFYPSASLLSDDYCPFCDVKVIEAQKFYENDDVVALYTHKPVMPGHCLIIPKRHVERFEGITDEEGMRMIQVIKKVDRAAASIFGTSSYLLLQKNGLECGQSVPHIHIHYIPRFAGDNSMVKFYLRLWTANVKQPIDLDEMQTITQQMREACQAQLSAES